ncbi:UDP-4-amino-4,6-dideoxy-N-acetyl-beta-L-altrosamine transaminase [Tenuibacillus multivorans]|uniref:UDP-4-amino-4,6-dideoxy-N-acetyl-beta-L-altrosamine transaminase n=1 Tax=Tenuibacillus multivorans TaxID=237069 RepID=A0A1G9YNE3_9BACI|nr:UDP-4-amino-4,6-dideoxy-N-acetyl-beta-L-altrosamine transaminase [Tenuibacillus multivorans]GEL78484.1 spore coat protein [Tenuibacillus multivorans]SDN10590.1 UDP-4-amino-4,6-dideoxy-N-acetyl-beta-L-altrosamine transaminase [Tenuibacillus multivorans]
MEENNQLAYHGGAPVRESFLPYGRQFIDEQDIQSIVQVLRSDYLTTGPTIQRLEEELAGYVQAKYTVLFSSGTAALHAACYAAGIENGDEVITTPMTFAASANSVLYNGGTPIFADIDPDTYNISPQAIKSQINDKTKAIMPVDFTGLPCDYDAIRSIADEYGLTVIEDAAHALGAQYKNQPIGSLSDMTIFSFHPVKHMTTGEGGAVATNNLAFYEKLKQFRTHGITKNREQLLDDHGPWYYEMQFLGFNYRMTDLQAALGLSQLNKLDDFIRRRKQIVVTYQESFQHMKTITTPEELTGYESSWHLYVMRLKHQHLYASRRTIFKALQAENIGVNVHYIPVYYHPYYLQLGYRKGICPHAEQLYETIITLPLFPAMSDGDVADVIEAVQKVITYYSKRR